MTNDFLEEAWRASEPGRVLGNVVGGENQPAPGLAIAIDQLFGRSDITAAVLKEICPEKVQVSRSGVELLAAPSTTREVFFDIALRPRARVGKGIGKG